MEDGGTEASGEKCIVHSSQEGKSGGQKLHTLGTISPQSCTEEYFDRACGLKKLGIRDRIVTLVDAGGLEKLKNLDRLELVNDPFPLLSFDGRLPSLPKPYEFPPKLRSLTLFSTCLDWTHMSILGMLDTLEVLKLKHRAFVGMRWEAADGGFCHLEILCIEQTDLVDWLATGHHFRGLDALHLGIVRSLKQFQWV